MGRSPVECGSSGSWPMLRRCPGAMSPAIPTPTAPGYVTYPNVNPAMEMTDLLGAVRAYQLNAAAVQATKNMIQQSLQILS